MKTYNYILFFILKVLKTPLTYFYMTILPLLSYLIIYMFENKFDNIKIAPHYALCLFLLPSIFSILFLNGFIIDWNKSIANSYCKIFKSNKKDLGFFISFLLFEIIFQVIFIVLIIIIDLFFKNKSMINMISFNHMKTEYDISFSWFNQICRFFIILLLFILNYIFILLVIILNEKIFSTHWSIRVFPSLFFISYIFMSGMINFTINNNAFFKVVAYLLPQRAITWLLGSIYYGSFVNRELIYLTLENYYDILLFTNNYVPFILIFTYISLLITSCIFIERKNVFYEKNKN
ncbi:hypothetical protein [Spiroplasma endosymbiont of Aspidapion aeneum]|uniref:hypothetical protein n=1 Tax=Spiroplasma endosymbiont of Aspidapion aeneum TaxID=3066276 RepID=UPI00313BF8CA